MFSVPVTFLMDFKFQSVDDKMRSYLMHEFAANGAKHLVLSDALLKTILAERGAVELFVREMEAEGLSFLDAHAPFGKFQDLNCPIPEARAIMLLRHKLILHIIASMGIRTITIHTGSETAYPDCPLEVQTEFLKRSLDELLPLAESLGVVICLENTWFQINIPERLLAVKAAFPTDALGFCYDAGHANLMDKGRAFPDSYPVKAWQGMTPHWDDRILEKMLPQVVNCHLHDNDGISDQHCNIGQGTVNWETIVRQLKKAPRLQVVQSEVIPVSGHISIRDICSGLRRLSELS